MTNVEDGDDFPQSCITTPTVFSKYHYSFDISVTSSFKPYS